jgi:hypothetical protein
MVVFEILYDLASFDIILPGTCSSDSILFPGESYYILLIWLPSFLLRRYATTDL